MDPGTDNLLQLLGGGEGLTKLNKAKSKDNQPEERKVLTKH